MIRLLLDQGLPRSAAHLLRQAGWDVQHVGECGLAAASDADILDAAREAESIVCTLDADFHALLATSGADGPSVIRIRREGLQGADFTALILAIWPRIESAVRRGAMVTVTEQAIRFRHLPIPEGSASSHTGTASK